jgi:hypothetical protein
MKYKLTIFLLTFACITQAQQNESQTSWSHSPTSGGFFIEPIVQYSQIDSEIKTSQIPLIRDDTSGTSDGAGLGLRLGGHLFDIMFIAADGRYSKLKSTDSSYGDSDGSSYNYGPTLGVQTPLFGVRVWGTYIIGGEFDPSLGSDQIDAKFQDARGTRLGAGLRFAVVSLNLEYETMTYNTAEIQSVRGFNVSSSQDIDTTSDAYLLSLSFPISL